MMTRKDIRAPLCTLINRGSFHGAELVLHIAMVNNDASWFAEQTLLRAEELNLIERGKYDPTPEQRFFGLGGFSGGVLAGLKDPHRSPVAFHWITKTTKWLTEEDLNVLWFVPGEKDCSCESVTPVMVRGSGCSLKR